jgi:uncharacterized membrane protein
VTTIPEQGPPAWRRHTPGEHRWPQATAVVVAVALQLILPERLAPQARYVLPALEIVLLGVLVTASPFRLDRESTVLRAAGLATAGLVSIANAWSAVLLVRALVGGTAEDAHTLLLAGAAIWLTNVIVFALWYWELDRGGPAARAHGRRRHPDFAFAQMQSPDLADPDWEPRFADYLYLAFTNATAFSPTDVLPLTRWAKLTMMAQSVVALVVVVLVVARAVNVLG